MFLYVAIVRIFIDLTSCGFLGFPTALPPIKYYWEDGIPWESPITRIPGLPPGALPSIYPQEDDSSWESSPGIIKKYFFVLFSLHNVILLAPSKCVTAKMLE